MAGPRFSAICEYDSNTWAQIYADAGDDLSLATSPKNDPHNWTEYGSNPILTAVGGIIRGCAVIWDSGASEFKVLYDIQGAICLATGSELEDLTKHDGDDTPVFSGTGTPDDWERWVRHPSLNKIGSTYHMYYDGRQDSATGEIGAIGHATSSNCINWSRDGNNPILEPQGAGWESSDVGTPVLAFISEEYRLFYAGYDGSGSPWPHEIGYCTQSGDFSTYVRNADNPVLSMGSSGAWDDALVQGAAIMIGDDQTVYLYYSGRKESTSTDAIGYATLTY